MKGTVTATGRTCEVAVPTLRREWAGDGQEQNCDLRKSEQSKRNRLMPLRASLSMFRIAEEDQNPSPTDAQALAQKIKAAQKEGQVKVFAGAGHAFLADYRPTYREKPAFELWADVVEFFHRHLG